MGTKLSELTDPQSCFNKAGENEPIFVIRGNDILGAHIVEEWANLAASLKVHEPEKISEAMQLAQSMRDWRNIPF